MSNRWADSTRFTVFAYLSIVGLGRGNDVIELLPPIPAKLPALLDNRLALFWDIWGLCLGLLLGYLATSGAKSDVIFYNGDEISRLSRLVLEI